jgi:hypothetical protein
MSEVYEIPTSVSAKVESKNQTIPKIIYQTFKTNKVTDKIFYGVQTWIQFNPDYSYEFYDDKRRDEYVKNFNCEGLNFTNKQLNEAYDSILPQAGKSDIWRYLILYEKGGVYTDIDTVCKYPLSTYIESNDTIVTGVVGYNVGYKISKENLKRFGSLFSSWYHLFFQFFMTYSPKNPIIKFTLEGCINSVINRIPIEGSEDCENLLERYTGPCVLNYGVRKFFNISKNEDFKEIKGSLSVINKDDQQIRFVSVHSKIEWKYLGYEHDLRNLNVSHWRDQKVFIDEESNNLRRR